MARRQQAPHNNKTHTAGISAARGSRGEHISDVKWQSFVRGGAGGFAPAFSVGRQASVRLKEGSAIGDLNQGAPYTSVLSGATARKSLRSENYSNLVYSMESQDVAKSAQLLRGQAVKRFLNKVKPNHLSKIEHFMQEELRKFPKNRSGDLMQDMQRLSIVSTAWQALNDCLPQFRGTLEDIREMYDARVDCLRLSLSFLETEMDVEEDIHDKNNYFNHTDNNGSSFHTNNGINTSFNNPSITPTTGAVSSSITNANPTKNTNKRKGRRIRGSSIGSHNSGTSGTSGTSTSGTSGTSGTSRTSNSTDSAASNTSHSLWNPVGSIDELRSFWTDATAHHSKQVKRPGGSYLNHIQHTFLPCLMTTYHELSRHITGISKVRGRVLEHIWHRSMLLIASICRHAKRLHAHHTKVLQALKDSLRAEQIFLRTNEEAVEHYNHVLKPAELYKQEELGSALKEQETQLGMLRERKNALSRVKKTLESLVAEYSSKRHTQMADEERKALEEQVSMVTLGGLSSGMEKQQDRLRKAELALVNADLLVKMKRVKTLLDEIKANVRSSVGSRIKKDVCIQVDASEQAWTVEVGSSRKMAPSQGWWTLHREDGGGGGGGGGKKDKRTIDLEQYNLASGMTNESKFVSLPAMFVRILTLGAPKSQVRSMSKLSFYKTVHAIFDSMLEAWEEGGGEIQRKLNSRSSEGVTGASVHGWESSTTVTDFVYDYFLLQFGIAELSEPKLLQLLATSYRLRKKTIRAKIFALICGIIQPTDRRGRTVQNLHNRFHEDALQFYIGAYSALRNEHSMGRCIELTKRSLYYAELHIAIYLCKDIFYTDTEKTLQTMINTVKQQHEIIIVEKTMLGLDRRNAAHNAGGELSVINVDLLMNLWLTKWTKNIANSLKRFKILFVASDVNEDGRLSYREFSTTLKALDPYVESYTIAELFRGCIRKTKQGGAEIDCNSFAYHMTRNTDYMAAIRWEGRNEINGNNGSSSDTDGKGRANSGDSSSTSDDSDHSDHSDHNDEDGDGSSHATLENDNEKSCIQMYGSPSSHKYSDVSRSVRELRENWSRWKGLIQKHLDWLLEHAKTPDEKWDSEHCYKRLGHFETLFEHSLDGSGSAELAWQAFRFLRHQTETLRKNRTMLSHAMAPIHLISRFKKKMMNVTTLSSKKKESEEKGETDKGGETNEENATSKKSDEENAALAFSSVRWHHVDKLVSMLDFDVIDINVVNHQGNTLLHTACQNGHLDIVRRLCRKKIALNAQNNSGDTAMHFARYYDYDEIFRYLRQQEANDTLRNNAGETCYEKVASSGM